MAAVGSPEIRVFAVNDHVDGYRSQRGDVSIDLGSYLGVTGADLEFHVGRATYGDPVEAVQVLGDGTTVPIPPDLLNEWWGFRDFFHLVIYRGDDRIRNLWSGYCPNSWSQHRLDDSGPADPTYPYGCWGQPFSLGMVWGIDQGWASAIELFYSIQLREGEYTLRLAIGQAYRGLLQIADEEAAVTLDLTVHDGGGGCQHCEERTSPRGGDAQDALSLAPIDTDPDPETTADLVALPAFAFGTEARRGSDWLAFGSNVWNRGPAPLVVEGFRAEGEDLMDAYQYFFLDGEVVGKAPVGSFALDERDGHHHWHFLQFARYRLLDADMVNAVRSHKQSFCLAPTDPIDLLVRGAQLRTGELGFSQCGGDTSIWIREMLPAGWGDTYYQYVAGQSFDITDVPNGTYYVEVTANPFGLLYDARPGNNTRLRKVILGGRPGDRTVSVPPWRGIDTG
jgi:Lysyl oxidase